MKGSSAIRKPTSRSRDVRHGCPSGTGSAAGRLRMREANQTGNLPRVSGEARGFGREAGTCFNAGLFMRVPRSKTDSCSHRAGGAQAATSTTLHSHRSDVDARADLSSQRSAFPGATAIVSTVAPAHAESRGSGPYDRAHSLPLMMCGFISRSDPTLPRAPRPRRMSFDRSMCTGFRKLPPCVSRSRIVRLSDVVFSRILLSHGT